MIRKKFLVEVLENRLPLDGELGTIGNDQATIISLPITNLDSTSFSMSSTDATTANRAFPNQTEVLEENSIPNQSSADWLRFSEWRLSVDLNSGSTQSKYGETIPNEASGSLSNSPARIPLEKPTSVPLPEFKVGLLPIRNPGDSANPVGMPSPFIAKAGGSSQSNSDEANRKSSPEFGDRKSQAGSVAQLDDRITEAGYGSATKIEGTTFASASIDSGSSETASIESAAVEVTAKVASAEAAETESVETESVAFFTKSAHAEVATPEVPAHLRIANDSYYAVSNPDSVGRVDTQLVRSPVAWLTANQASATRQRVLSQSEQLVVTAVVSQVEVESCQVDSVASNSSAIAEQQKSDVKLILPADGSPDANRAGISSNALFAILHTASFCTSVTVGMWNSVVQEQATQRFAGVEATVGSEPSRSHLLMYSISILIGIAWPRDADVMPRIAMQESTSLLIRTGRNRYSTKG